MERTKQGEFAWTDLHARDLDAQTAFYEGLFGWSHSDVPLDDGGVYRVFSLDGHTVTAAHQMAPALMESGVPSSWNVYIAVDDVDAQLARAVELGGQIAMPAMDVMGVARTGAIVDPTGAPVFLWHNTKPDAAAVYGEPGTRSWNELATRDPEKAGDFFSKLIGWDVTRMDQSVEPYWQVSVDGQGQGGIMPMPEMVPPQVPSFWLDYFATADVAASVAKAKELGASVSAEPTKVGDMLIFAVLDDPAGATFALLQPLTVV
jgi:hypothetical protein